MLKRFANFIVRSRTWIIVLFILLTCFFGYFARNVKISSDLLNLAPWDNKELIALNRSLAKFGSSTFILISVESEDAFSLSTLTKIKSISEEVKRLPEVEEVMDPLNATVFKYLFGMLVIRQSFPEGKIPASREQIEELKREMLSEPTLKNVVISENGETLAIYIKLKEESAGRDIREKIMAIISPYQGPERFYASGRPIIENWVKEYIRRDSLKLGLPILLLMVVVLFVNFRTVRGVLLPLVVMFGSIIWTLGLMGIFGKMISIIGLMLPTMIVVNSSSYCIRFLNQYYKDIVSEGGGMNGVAGSIDRIGITIILAAVTTIAGFASLTITKVRPMMELGVFVLIGVFIAMLLSVSFLPAALTVMSKPKRGGLAFMEEGRKTRLFEKLGFFVTERWKVVLVFAILVGIWAGWGIKDIQIDTSWQRFFKKNSEILRNQRFIRSNFGGISTLNVSFEITDPSLDFKRLETLRYIEQVEQWIKNNGLMGHTVSFVSYIKRANQLLNRNDPEAYKLPETDADLLKIILLFKMSQLTRSISNVISADFKDTNIVVRISGSGGPEISIPQMKKFVRDFNAYIGEHGRTGIDVRISGADLIYVSLIDYIVKNQLISIALSIAIVFFIIAFAFKSFTHGLFGLIPIFFGLFFNFATMSYFNVSMDFVTSMISSIAVGMGVDNAIQYLILFSRTDPSLPLGERVRSALITTGVPIFYSTLTLLAGFCVLLFSSFKPILYFGLLISVTMIGCLIGALVVLPAFIYFTKPKALINGRAL